MTRSSTGAGVPDLASLEVPALVTELATGRTTTPVWRNEIGQITWRLGELGSCDYLKHGAAHPEFNPAAEVARLTWVGAFVAAPRVLDHGLADDGSVWLLTAGLPGRSAIDTQPGTDRVERVRELGRVLRAFHDCVPVENCPFDWSVEHRLAELGNPTATPDLLSRIPDLDPVVCHGDACNPNFVFTDDGEFGGYVDLGHLGVADRWADLQPALLSAEHWNFPEVACEVFLDGYGIDFDQEKFDFYSEVYNAT